MEKDLSCIRNLRLRHFRRNRSYIFLQHWVKDINQTERILKLNYFKEEHSIAQLYFNFNYIIFRSHNKEFECVW